MLRRNILLLTALTSLLTAQTLEESLGEVLTTNPKVLSMQHAFKAQREEVDIARSGYLPKLDLRVGAGVSDIENETDPVAKQTYDGDAYTGYVKLSQNLFEGFATMNKMDESKASALSSAYKYVEVANDTAMKMVNAYIEVLKNKELLDNSRKNVEINEEIFKKVQKLYESGLTTLSEVNKIESSLALSRSNYVVQENNLLDAKHTFTKVLGRPMPYSELTRPVVTDAALPATVEEAKAIAMKTNPSVVVSMYNIKQAQYRQKGSRSAYYPRLDLEVTESYDENPNFSGSASEQDFRVMVYLTYNLFNGFADESEVQKNISKLHSEIQNRHDLERQVLEGLNLSWASYTKLDEQLTHLNNYKKFSEDTLKLYVKEYDLGRRSLLDLLAAQNDYIGSQAQIITTEYNLLLSKYRILDAMGTMVQTVMNRQDVVYADVGIDAEQPQDDDVPDTNEAMKEN
jgi:adhesin transport system outer membrane protein